MDEKIDFSFQNIILSLQHFWGQQGCALVQPYDMEMGAGTFHPFTVLKALGPNPWKVAYAQTCRRPADGRYGKNQNRLGHYVQFQVLLKPAPVNIQDLYLNSLLRFGIEPLQHDIRFVEDDWESPTLGAWGLGWEVWCDGMEISQFTYFQQVCSVTCDPVSVEITYGLERLAMYIQGKESVFDLVYAPGLTYGDLFFKNEMHYSAYYFKHTDSDILRSQFETCERECQRLVALHLSIPAYDQCIQASHLLNMLDARGAISVAQRQDYIARVRALAKACAVNYASSSHSIV